MDDVRSPEPPAADRPDLDRSSEARSDPGPDRPDHRPPTRDRPPAGAGTADPLPQAMVLTAIVITFGVTAFLLALAFRSWLLTGEDFVQDDVEDRRIAAAEPQERPHTARPEDDA